MSESYIRSYGLDDVVCNELHILFVSLGDLRNKTDLFEETNYNNNKNALRFEKNKSATGFCPQIRLQAFKNATGFLFFKRKNIFF